MIKDSVDVFHISYNTAVNRVVNMNIVAQDKEKYRNRIFVEQRYIDIFVKCNQNNSIVND